MNSKQLKPHYQINNNEPWFDKLKHDVNKLVKSTDKTVKMRMHIKATVLFVAYIFFYSLLLFNSHSTGQMFVWYALLGLSLIFLFLNTAHDISHNALFSNRRWNEQALVLLDILGDNSVIWKRRHVHYHHVYSNVLDWDMDIRQSPLVVFFPRENTVCSIGFSIYICHFSIYSIVFTLAIIVTSMTYTVVRDW
jgi:linoleoyl-CoA desaturase